MYIYMCVCVCVYMCVHTYPGYRDKTMLYDDQNPGKMMVYEKRIELKPFWQWSLRHSMFSNRNINEFV